jgi:hypothetical protein
MTAMRFISIEPHLEDVVIVEMLKRGGQKVVAHCIVRQALPHHMNLRMILRKRSRWLFVD